MIHPAVWYVWGSSHGVAPVLVQLPPMGAPVKPTMADVLNAVLRVESKLDVLVRALADEEPEQGEFGLDDGVPVVPRDQTREL